jgi:hypothetical protein
MRAFPQKAGHWGGRWKLKRKKEITAVHLSDCAACRAVNKNIRPILGRARVLGWYKKT